MSATIKYKGNTIATASNNTKTLLTAGKYMEANVVVTDNGGGGGATLQTKSVTYTPSASQQTDTVTPDAGYDGLDQVNVTVNAVSAGSATTPATTITANPTITISGNSVSASVSKTQSITPTVSAGYVASGTAGTITVSGSDSATIQSASNPYIDSASIDSSGNLTVDIEVDTDGYVASTTYSSTMNNAFSVQGAQTIHPSTSDQTIASSKYLTGAQTIKGVLLTNLSAGNIKKDVVVKVGDSTDDDCVTSVTGTYEGGGGGYTNDDFADLSKPIGAVTTTLASLPPYFFYNRTGITKFTGNNVTTLESPSYAYCHTFYGCTALEEVVLPSVTTLYDKNSVFRNCTSLRKVDLSSVKGLNSSSCFRGDAQLEGIVFPGASSGAGNAGTTLGNNMFDGCTSLAYFDSAMVYNIQAATFTSCSSLSVVVIRYSPNTGAGNISALANVSAFNGTPFASGGSGGTLYVPSAKIATYQAATNWSTILGYPNNQIKAIEGSYYETHYADGTAI